MKEPQSTEQQESVTPQCSENAADSHRSVKASRIPDNVRSELTIEKWPAIWRPAKSPHEPQTRTFQRSITLKDGGARTAKVEVGFTQLGNLTTEDQKTYYALIRQWESKSKPPDFTFFSIRKLARVLKRRWGTNVIQSITESLRRLRTTPFAWTNSYRDSTTGEEVEVLDTFTILSDLKIVRRKSDGHVTHEAGYFRFHEMMLKNLLANHTKPVRFDVILSFKSEIAQLLYTHIDLMLARNDHYERRSIELFDDLGLQGKAYRNASDRKRKLERALAELRNVPLSTGIVASATVERTKDQKDYKVVFSKAKRDRISHSNASKRLSKPIEKNHNPEEAPLSAQAKVLVSHFHGIFHGPDRPSPRPKEIAQAVGLIARYGFESARYIVEFSREAAEETNFAPQTFGGILQYESRAIAELNYYDRLREIGREQLAARQAADPEATAEEKVLHDRLESLSDPEYRRLYDFVRQDFAARFPRVMAIRPKLFESAIKVKMADMLDRGESRYNEFELDPAA